MATLMLFLDAFKFEYLTKENVPFIHSLAKEGAYGNLHTLPGYHIEYSILSGSYPTRHNVWAWFYNDPKNSAFSWLRNWRWLFHRLDKTPLSNMARNFITYYTSLRRYKKGKTRLLKINRLPLDKCTQFNISVDKSYVDRNSMCVPTIFDIMRRKGMKYIASEWPIIGTHDSTKVLVKGSSDAEKFRFLKESLKKDYGFRFCHFWNLDSKMHKYGVDSPEVKKHLKDLDNWVKDLVTAAREKEETDVIIFSDHGMVPIEKAIDVQKLISSLDIGKHVIFPGSTIARVWLEDPKDKKKVMDALRSLKAGKVYDSSNIKELHIPYKREYVGDVFFQLSPGIQISPNYFQDNETAKAMHGYSEHIPPLDGIFIINGRVKKKRFRDAELVDVAPTTLKLLGLDIPKTADGRSVI